jgi:hypothetical protein
MLYLLLQALVAIKLLSMRLKLGLKVKISNTTANIYLKYYLRHVAEQNTSGRCVLSTLVIRGINKPLFSLEQPVQIKVIYLCSSFLPRNAY